MLILDSSKARKELNWSEKLSFEESISWTVDVYKEVNNGKNQRSVLEAQINKYQSM
jgi:CDP-glucose 4,6-dehydratase